MLQKFAAALILGAGIADGHSPALMRTAHRAQFNYTPRPGYLYVRSRMISSRCNDNHDEFPAEEIERGYHTFIGKPVFVNHHNEDHRRARGVIIDAVLHKDANPDGSPDTWVEGLQEVDALTYPRLAKAIIAGDIDRTSMGVDVAYSICSVCANKATTPLEYCRHIPAMKGMKVLRRTADGTSRPELVRERCHGLSFFENSLLVEEPADPTAFVLGQVERGPGLEHLARTATRTTAAPARVYLHRGGPAYTQNTTGAGLQHITAYRPGGSCPACRGANTISAQGSAECFDCEHTYVLGAPPLVREAAPRHADPGEHPFFQENPVSAHHIVAKYNSATDDEKASGHHWYSDAGLVAHALGTLHKGHPETGEPHPRGNTHLAAGMIANYSAQTPWADNQHHAARVLHTGVGIGGQGSGIFASASQRNKANRMLRGATNDEELTSPKISDFGHLVEHGGDADPAHPHVVVDRHALSVAMGRRASEKDYSDFPKSTRHYYGHVVDQYHAAARQISEQTGHPVAAHQVQATTWLAQQRENQRGEKAVEETGADSRLNRGRNTRREQGEQKWNDFRQQHLPDLHANPGTGYTSSRGRRGRR